MTEVREDWYALANTREVISPSLLVYPDRIEKNIQLMIQMIGDPKRLRPHIKTHKTAEIVKMQMDHDIEKFKCATIAEAELLGSCGAKDILLAMQPVGANIKRFTQLVENYPLSRFSTLVDSETIIHQLSESALENDLIISLFLDLNTGMNRTGIVVGDKALKLYKLIVDDPNLEARGLHAYDGHIRNENIEVRKQICDEAFRKVEDLKTALETQGLEVPTIVAGGSPTFPIHASRKGVEASPGTTLLWDERYNGLFEDMDFLPAAVLFCRIVSKPKDDLICLDIGHKAIAPEMDFPRVRIMGLEEGRQIGQSEEHLVIRCPDTSNYEIGDCFYAIPVHVCPTVAKYPKLLTVENGEITGSWQVAARDHQLSI